MFLRSAYNILTCCCCHMMRVAHLLFISLCRLCVVSVSLYATAPVRRERLAYVLRAYALHPLLLEEVACSNRLLRTVESSVMVMQQWLHVSIIVAVVCACVFVIFVGMWSMMGYIVLGPKFHWRNNSATLLFVLPSWIHMFGLWWCVLCFV